MFIEKKIIKGKPYYYLREKVKKRGRWISDTVAYLGKNFLVAYIRAILIMLKIIKPELAL